MWYSPNQNLDSTLRCKTALNSAIREQKPRRNFSADFKAKVAVEALKEQQTLSQLATKFELYPTRITDWKKQLLGGSSTVFESGKTATAAAVEDPEKDELYKAVGQVKIENVWPKKIW